MAGCVKKIDQDADLAVGGRGLAFQEADRDAGVGTDEGAD